MLIKLDMKNSFDRVKLPFHYEVLISFGFSSEFVNLIKACIDRPWIVLLGNGIPTKNFQATRGLWQGCQMSHFLYILMAENFQLKWMLDTSQALRFPGERI